MGVTVDLCACRCPGSINTNGVSATNGVEGILAGVSCGGWCGGNRLDRVVGYGGQSWRLRGHAMCCGKLVGVDNRHSCGELAGGSGDNVDESLLMFDERFEVSYGDLNVIEEMDALL